MHIPLFIFLSQKLGKTVEGAARDTTQCTVSVQDEAPAPKATFLGEKYSKRLEVIIEQDTSRGEGDSHRGFLGIA